MQSGSAYPSLHVGRLGCVRILSLEGQDLLYAGKHRLRVALEGTEEFLEAGEPIRICCVQVRHARRTRVAPAFDGRFDVPNERYDALGDERPAAYPAALWLVHLLRAIGP